MLIVVLLLALSNVVIANNLLLVGDLECFDDDLFQDAPADLKMLQTCLHSLLQTDRDYRLASVVLLLCVEPGGNVQE